MTVSHLKCLEVKHRCRAVKAALIPCLVKGMKTTEETMTMNIEELQKVFKSHGLNLEIVSNDQIAWRDEYANVLRVRVYLNQQHIFELHSECRSIGYAAEQIEHLIADTKEEIEDAFENYPFECNPQGSTPEIEACVCIDLIKSHRDLLFLFRRFK